MFRPANDNNRLYSRFEKSKELFGNIIGDEIFIIGNSGLRADKYYHPEINNIAYLLGESTDKKYSTGLYPKVDFPVLHQPLDEKPTFIEFNDFVGTPALFGCAEDNLAYAMTIELAARKACEIKGFMIVLEWNDFCGAVRGLESLVFTLLNMFGEDIDRMFASSIVVVLNSENAGPDSTRHNVLK